MKIALVGNFSAPYSTESDWAWTYEHLGHEVIRLQEEKVRTEYIFKEVQKGVNLVHYVHTHGWVTPGRYSIEMLFSKIRKLGIPIISVHLDYWRGLKREVDVGTHPFWHTDFVFTADGGSNDWYRSKGINHFYLPAGVVERDCYLGKPRDDFKYDVIFVGSYGYHPEWPYRPQLIDWLKNTYGSRFERIAGDTKFGTVRGEALNDLYASAKVVVGDTLCLNFSHPDYFSDRLFETTGRGGFMIFPYIKGLEDMFVLHESFDMRKHPQDEKDIELITYDFNHFAQLKSLIDYFISHDEERGIIRLAGHARTKRNHTYTNRVNQMLEIVFNGKNTNK
jgi:hypothetical protein